GAAPAFLRMRLRGPARSPVCATTQQTVTAAGWVRLRWLRGQPVARETQEFHDLGSSREILLTKSRFLRKICLRRCLAACNILPNQNILSLCHQGMGSFWKRTPTPLFRKASRAECGRDWNCRHTLATD